MQKWLWRGHFCFRGCAVSPARSVPPWPGDTRGSPGGWAVGMKGCPGAFLSHLLETWGNLIRWKLLSHTAAGLFHAHVRYLFTSHSRQFPWKGCENSEVLQGGLILGNFRQALRWKNSRLKDLDKKKGNNGTLLV